MTTELTPNKAAWLNLIFAVALPFAFLCFLVYNIFYPTESLFGLTPQSGYQFWLFFAAALVSCAWAIRKCYLMPSGAVIDFSLKTIEVKYIMKGKRFIRFDELVNYTYTTVRGRNSRYQGLYLYLADGTKVLFSDLNFSDYSPVETFLNDNKVERIAD